MDSLILDISSVIEDTNDSSIKVNKFSNYVLNNMKELNLVIKNTVAAIDNLQKNLGK